MLDFNEFGESWVTKEQHNQALAEKDREIASIKRADKQEIARHKDAIHLKLSIYRQRYS